MPVYRVDRTVNEDRWWIQKVTKGMLTFNHNNVYDTDVTITPMVKKHLDKISAGWVPYGYTVYSDCEEENDI